MACSKTLRNPDFAFGAAKVVCVDIVAVVILGCIDDDDGTNKEEVEDGPGGGDDRGDTAAAVSVAVVPKGTSRG